MDENGSVSAPLTADGKTSDDLLAEIEAAKRAVSEKEVISPAPTASEVPDTESGKQPQNAETSESASDVPAPQGEPVSEPGGKAVDYDEWMKKKGFKSVQDMAKAMRNLEQELSRRPARSLDETRPMQPDPVITTQSRFIPQPNNLEELAAQYETDPDSFRRVMRIVNDAADLKMRMGLTPFANEIQQLKTELRKERQQKELEQDPSFKNRAVMQEMYQLLESDPSIQNSPDPMIAAHRRALENLGRRFAEGLEQPSSGQEARSETIPVTPPPLGKSGQGSSKTSHGRPSLGRMTPEKFNSLSSTEMEKYLAQNGMVRRETF